jgi:hypothetical protein
MDCHIHRRNRSTDFALLTEYTTWRTLDKHSQAYLALEGLRAREMAERLRVAMGREEPLRMTDGEAGCLGCHALDPKKPGAQFSKLDGVSCDGCHGPSEGWMEKHSRDWNDWRRCKPQEKELWGMRDLRDPVKRAELCMSCHVGSVAEGKVITHAMYAAGHPPLPPFEVATFCANLPQHWRDLKDVPFFQNLAANKDLSDKDRKQIAEWYDLVNAPVAQTRLTLVGGLVALRQTMRLVADRADLEAKKDLNQRWPELLYLPTNPARGPADVWEEAAMAHSDCCACHHELKSEGWRLERSPDLALPGGRKVAWTHGRVPLRRWPTALVEPGIGRLTVPGGETASTLASGLAAVYKACNARPFGDPRVVGPAAASVSQWPAGKLGDKKLLFQPGQPSEILLQLCTLAESRPADFETARQLAAAFRAIHAEWDPKGDKAPDVPRLLKKLDEPLNLNPYRGRGGRVELLRQLLLARNPQRALPKPDDLQRLLERVSNRDYLLELAKEKGLQDAYEQVWSLLEKMKSADFADFWSKGESLKAVDRLSNVEIDKMYEAQAKYDPQAFRDAMAALRKAITGPK